MSDQKDLITVRPYDGKNVGEREFVLACWLRGVFYGDTFFSHMKKSIFMEHYHKVLERFIDNPGVDIQMAVLQDDPQVILGYSVARKSAKGEQVLDWVFVKSAWRKIGIAKMLVPPDVVLVTHLTRLGRALKPEGVEWNPFV
jgi:hypothetical protein